MSLFVNWHPKEESYYTSVLGKHPFQGIFTDTHTLLHSIWPQMLSETCGQDSMIPESYILHASKIATMWIILSGSAASSGCSLTPLEHTCVKFCLLLRMQFFPRQFCSRSRKSLQHSILGLPLSS